MRSLKDAEQSGLEFAEAVGAASLEDLRKMDASAFSRQTVVTGGA